MSECPECLGHGYIECPNCDGTGEVEEEYEQLQLPGVQWGAYEGKPRLLRRD